MFIRVPVGRVVPALGHVTRGVSALGHVTRGVSAFGHVTRGVSAFGHITRRVSAPFRLWLLRGRDVGALLRAMARWWLTLLGRTCEPCHSNSLLHREKSRGNLSLCICVNV